MWVGGLLTEYLFAWLVVVKPCFLFSLELRNVVVFICFVISDFVLWFLTSQLQCVVLKEMLWNMQVICMRFVKSANCGYLQDIVSGRPGPVPFSKCTHLTPVDTVNLIGLHFESPCHLDESCSDASVKCYISSWKCYVTESEWRSVDIEKSMAFGILVINGCLFIFLRLPVLLEK